MIWIVLLVALILSFIGGMVYAIIRLALAHNSPVVQAEMEKLHRQLRDG